MNCGECFVDRSQCTLLIVCSSIFLDIRVNSGFAVVCQLMVEGDV
jgi:hypothetical protein